MKIHTKFSFIKKQSKKRQIEDNDDLPRGKKQKLENNCSSYEGSQESLLFGKKIIPSYDENVETAIDEALRLCEEIDCGDTDEQSCEDMKCTVLATQRPHRG